MSIVAWDTEPKLGGADLSLLPPPEADQVGPSLSEAAAAAFRIDNVFGSVTSYVGPSREERAALEPDFDFFGEIAGTPYERHWRSGVDIFNRGAFNKWKAQVDRENLDRETLDAAGWTGTGLSALAVLADPTILIPGGSLYRGVKGGYSVLKSAASVGAMGAVAAGTQEAFLQPTQETRTATETGLAIGAGAVLGALLGSGASAILSKAELASTARAIDTAMATKADDTQFANELEVRQSLSAAASPEVSIDDLSVAGRGAQAVSSIGNAIRLNVATAWVNSPSAEMRRTMARIVNNHAYLNMNNRGETLGTDLENSVKIWERGVAYAGGAIKSIREEYKAAVQRGLKIPESEFGLLVTRAFRNNAESDIPEVRKAALAMRAVDDALGKEAKNVGLDYREQKDSPTHGLRLWNKAKMDQERPQVIETIKDSGRARIEERVAREHARKARVDATIEDEITDLQLGPEETAQLLKQLPEEIKALRAENARFLPFDERMTEARRLSRTDRAAARESIKRIREEAGQDYADYVSKRARLNARLNRIRQNVVSKENEVEKVRAKIADAEIANLTRLSKLHEQLGVLDRRAEAEGPEVVAEELANARTQFVKLLEKSTEAQVRLSELEARLEAEAKAGEAGPAEATEQLIIRKQTEEEKRIAKLTELADEISELEAIDPEDVIRNLDQLVTRRLEDTANLIERETERMMRLAARAEKADPEKVKGRIEQLRAKKAASDAAHNDLLYRQLDADNNYEGYLSEYAEDVFNRLTGRFDTPGGVRFAPMSRGPLRNRVPNLEDNKFERWLENDPEIVIRRTARLMAGQIELARRFDGDITLAEPIRKIREDFAKERDRILSNEKLSEKTKGKRIRALGQRENRDIAYLEAMRDMVTGVYMARENVAPAARILGGITQLNYLRAMGSITIASLTDLARPAMVHGLGNFMRFGVKPLVGNLKAMKLARADAQMGGTGTERWVHSRVEGLAGLHDPFNNRSPVENILRNLSSLFSHMTGIILFTDFMKDFTGIITQQRIMRGVLGQKNEGNYLAYLGLDSTVQERIKRQVEKWGFEEGDLRIANTSKWDDEVARRAFYAAINKDVDTIIISPGMADLPLAARNPILAPMFQFRSFNLAANQAVLMRGMQESAAGFASGMVAMTAIGMFAYYLRLAQQNRLDELENKDWDFMVMKGLDHSGLFSVLFDVNNVMEKGLGVGAYSLVGGDESVYASKSFASSLMGPTGDFVDKLSRVSQQIVKGDMTEGGVNSLRQLAPFLGLPYVLAPLEYGVMPAWRGQVEGD